MAKLNKLIFPLISFTLISFTLISFTLILVSSISFFFNKKVKDYFIISTLSIVVGFYIFEVYLIIKKPIIKKINYKQHIKKELIFKKETGKEFDKRSPLKIYDEYNKIPYSNLFYYST